MPEEVEILKQEMTQLRSTKIAQREYHTGILYGLETSLVFSRWGKVAASIAATTLITKFNVDCIIFLGVAGAICDDLNMGDVVVGWQLYQHDMDARPLFPQFQIPMTDFIFLNADPALCHYAENAARDFCTNIKTTLAPEVLQEFFINQPAVYAGIIASGDSFIAGRQQREAIRSKMPEALAVEMEGAAVAQVCVEHHIPFTVIRVISDKADHSAAVDFPKFVAGVACYYSKNILKSMYDNMNIMHEV